MHKSDAVSSCDVGTLDSLENPVDVKTSDILEDCSDVLLPEEEPPTVFNTPTIERDELYEKFKSKILVNAALDRSLVSNQANKKLSFYSWFSYKEGFSEPFVSYILGHLIQHPKTGILLDPFSGSGSALFAASAKGWQTKGIELLPVGNFATNMRFIAERVDAHKVGAAIADLLQIDDFTRYYSPDNAIKHITITSGAFPQLEEQQLVGYISYCKNYILDEYIRELLLYGAFCILEEISYTRKDGQYLRWDARSGRSEGKNTFNKGKIYTFRAAIGNKLRQILSDLEGTNITQGTLFNEESSIRTPKGPPKLSNGSCLEILPQMENDSIDAVITSPPYANRYDYTRTYALELVYLGCDEDQVKQYRQSMLSCTVENKSKQETLYESYKEIGKEVDFDIIEKVFFNQKALQEVLVILDNYSKQNKLNNAGIARLVRNYFYEMCFVVYELARTLKPGGTIVMVNDNVRYAGEEVPVDLILSDMAESFGLTVKRIWTLGRGKGNSSQQMGNHGRTELRKCVYIWEKEAIMAKERDQLLIEAHQINYRLRSTFFYRKIKEYNVLAFPAMIANLFPTEDLYSWDERAKWGIGEDAFTYIKDSAELKPIQVFCHPRLLREYPAVLAYYRNIAALSQKSVGYLAGVDVKRYEVGSDNNTATLTSPQIFALTNLFNEHISLIIDSSIQSLTGNELHALLLTSTGAQIDGAWRNAIGEEAEKVVQRLLVKEAVKRGELVAFIHRLGTDMDRYDPAMLDEQLGHIEKYRGIILNNKTSLLFSSEPDITLVGINSVSLGVIEVKGGTDPAGALERYGAAKKSFENTLKEAPDAKTILVASCITDETRKRIREDKTITDFFNLTELIKDKDKYEEFVYLVFSILGIG